MPLNTFIQETLEEDFDDELEASFKEKYTEAKEQLAALKNRFSLYTVVSDPITVTNPEIISFLYNANTGKRYPVDRALDTITKLLTSSYLADSVENNLSQLKAYDKIDGNKGLLEELDKITTNFLQGYGFKPGYSPDNQHQSYTLDVPGREIPTVSLFKQDDGDVLESFTAMQNQQKNQPSEAVAVFAAKDLSMLIIKSEELLNVLGQVKERYFQYLEAVEDWQERMEEVLDNLSLVSEVPEASENFISLQVKTLVDFHAYIIGLAFSYISVLMDSADLLLELT